MKRIGTRQIVSPLLTVFAVVFVVIGFTQLGFWNGADGPILGSFPAATTIVMFSTSITSFIQSLKDEGSTRYERSESLVIAGGVGIIIGSYIVDLLLSYYLFIILWLKVFERTSWKDMLIVLTVCVAIFVGVLRLWLGVYSPIGLLEYIL